MTLSSSSTASNTIYLRNIPDSVSKNQLKQSLYELSSEYGVVIDIVALKTERMRGQAFVVFRDEVVASRALQGLDGFSFYGNKLVAQYARKPSQATMIANAAAAATTTSGSNFE